IVKVAILLHIFYRAAQTMLNHIHSISTTVRQAFTQVKLTWWQDKNLFRFRKKSTNLLRTLPVNFQQHIMAFGQLFFNGRLCSTVVITEYFCVFNKTTFIDQIQKIVFLGEMIVHAIEFARSLSACGMGHRNVKVIDTLK